jgi:hypothetical protein
MSSLFSYSAFRSIASGLPILLLCACASQALPPQDDMRKSQSHESGVLAPPSSSIGSLNASNLSAVTLARKARLKEWAEQQDRLYAVASPLLLKNAAICKNKTRLTSGIVSRTKYSYSDEFAEAAEQELGLSDRLQVMNVMSGSGADKSGIRRGDALLAVGANRIPVGAIAEREAARLMAAEMKGRGSVRLTLSREGREYVADMALTRVCDVDVELGNADHVNAYSDGKRSLITAGMLDYVRSDDELAIVIAKEIAHNIVAQTARPHMVDAIDSLRNFGLSAMPFHSLMKIRPYTAVRDATADKYSIYLLARTGHDIDKVLPFWKQLAARFPATQPDSYTALHPSTAYRLSVISAVTKVVKHNRQHGWPLIPH